MPLADAPLEQPVGEFPVAGLRQRAGVVNPLAAGVGAEFPVQGVLGVAVEVAVGFVHHCRAVAVALRQVVFADGFLDGQLQRLLNDDAVLVVEVGGVAVGANQAAESFRVNGAGQPAVEQQGFQFAGRDGVGDGVG